MDIISLLQPIFNKYVNKEVIRADVPSNVDTNSVESVLNHLASKTGGGNQGFSQLLALIGPMVSNGKFDFNSILGLFQGKGIGTDEVVGALDLDPADPNFDVKAKELAAYHLARAALYRRTGAEALAKADKIERVVSGISESLNPVKVGGAPEKQAATPKPATTTQAKSPTRPFGT